MVVLTRAVAVVALGLLVQMASYVVASGRPSQPSRAQVDSMMELDANRWVNPGLVLLAEASEFRALNQSEVATLSGQPVAEMRLLRLCILAIERGESRSWLNPPTDVPGWPYVEGSTHPLVVALRDYFRRVRSFNSFDVADYLFLHGEAGYEAEVLLHWPSLRPASREYAAAMGIQSSASNDKSSLVAEVAGTESPSMSTFDRVRLAFEVRRGVCGIPRTIELKGEGVDALVLLYQLRSEWPSWAKSSVSGTALFVAQVVEALVAWGDPRWELVTDSDWGTLPESVAQSLIWSSVADLGTKWPNYLREQSAFVGFNVRSFGPGHPRSR